MNKDPILDMTPEEIEEACCKVLNYIRVDAEGTSCTLRRSAITGLMIEKLQEWKVSFSYSCAASAWWIGLPDNKGSSPQDGDLKAVFLRTAQALGHWSPPKKVEERFTYWRNKISGSIVEMRPEFIACQAVHPEEWQRVTVTPYKEVP